jgi:GntR family transcriptional regulator
MEIKMAQRKKLPLYLQIEAILKSKILTGELKEGDRLPPENELSKQFGVSPLTVRQALSFLVGEGLLDRRPGIGTMVKKNPDEKITLDLSGKIDELLSLGLETETRVLRSEVIQGFDKPVHYLKLNLTDPICFIEKVRYWKTIPMMVVEEYAPQSLIGSFLRNKKSTVSFYSVLTQKKGVVLKEAIQTIESSTADQRIASLLQIEMGSPLFYMERTFFEESGLPVLFQITFTRAEHFKFSVHLGREKKEKEMKWVVY